MSKALEVDRTARRGVARGAEGGGAEESPAPPVGTEPLGAPSTSVGGTTATGGASAIAPEAFPSTYSSSKLALNSPTAFSKGSKGAADAGEVARTDTLLPRRRRWLAALNAPVQATAALHATPAPPAALGTLQPLLLLCGQPQAPSTSTSATMRKSRVSQRRSLDG